jgi:hypothetical protein
MKQYTSTVKRRPRLIGYSDSRAPPSSEVLRSRPNSINRFYVSGIPPILITAPVIATFQKHERPKAATLAEKLVPAKR